ncbi:MAG: arsenate reductase ArsC [Deinococcus sp.]|nr:arsenate reductase ArsC [Deinococcus sp.]
MPGSALRVLILCTHNSARSQMGEGLLRRAAQELGLALEVHSAGTEATAVKEPAKVVMAELGIDLSTHTSKTLHDVPDAQNFTYVITVCSSANDACPVYPAATERRHYPFRDPSGGSLELWREVRSQMERQFMAFATALAQGRDVPPSYSDAPTTEAQ